MHPRRVGPEEFPRWRNLLTIQQESRRETLTFRFEGDRLVRRHADRSGANEISVPYADIDVRNWTTATVDRLRRYRFAVGAFCIVSALLAAAPLLPKASRATLAVAATVTLALEIARRRKVFADRYTMFRILEPRTRWKFIKVLHDAKRDRIVGELQARWTAVREELVRIDFSADPNFEAARFQRLRDRGMVTAEECDAAIARIAAAARQPRVAGAAGAPLH